MATIRIQTQYLENYSDSTTPHLKKKGKYVFTINNIEGDAIMYCDNLKEVLSELCEQQCNDYCRYEYIDHEIDFHGPDLSITSEMLTTAIQQDFAKNEPEDCNNNLDIECSASLDNEWANESN